MTDKIVFKIKGETEPESVRIIEVELSLQKDDNGNVDVIAKNKMNGVEKYLLQLCPSKPIKRHAGVWGVCFPTNKNSEVLIESMEENKGVK